MALNTDGVNKLVETTSRVMNPFSQSNIVVILLISGCAVVAAAAVFYYLHNRQRTDFYHSLPLSRTKLFTIHYGAGALLVLLPYLINLALTVLVVAANGYLSYLNAGDIFLSIGHHMLFFFAIYSMGVLSAILTGNWVTNLLLTTLFAVILPSFVGVYIMGMECFYQTFYLFGDLAQRLVCYLSPVTRYFTATSSSLMIKFPMGFLEYIIWLAVTIGLIAAALLLYKKRHSENAGAAIAFSWAKPLIKYPLILLFTLLGGMLFHAIGDDGDYQHWGWLIFGFFCGGIISSRIIEIVFAFDFRAIKANLKGLVLFTVLFAAFICIPIFDLTGYNDYVPEVGQIKAINISSYNLDGFDNDNDSYLYQSFYETRSEKDFLKARQLTDPANLTTGVELAQIAQQ
ncbi:MAG: hypothetical protein RR051_06870, partial [Clostridiales bacterium]